MQPSSDQLLSNDNAEKWEDRQSWESTILDTLHQLNLKPDKPLK